MNNKTYQRYLIGGVAMAVVFAGALAVHFAFTGHGAKDTLSPPKIAAADKSGPHIGPVAPEVASNRLAPMIAAELQQQPAATRDALSRIYEHFGNAPLWLESAAGTRRLNDLSKMTAFADTQGVATPKLQQLLGAANGRALDAESAAKTDIALTQETLHLAQELRLGAVSTDKLGISWILPTDNFDAVSGLTDAVEQNKLMPYLSALVPPDVQYKGLVTALQTYRDMASKGGWPEIPGADKEIVLDMKDPRTAVLQDRLAAEGYLALNVTADARVLSEALKRFQERNGLDTDGRAGKGTLAALNVSASERVAHIAANMERWRHTPRARGDNLIAVNTAATTLELLKNGAPVLKLNTVTGDKRHATPIMTMKMTGVTLNPRWEIPPSIASKEILPKLKKNPDYLVKNNMVVVDQDGDPQGQFVDWSQYSAKNFNLRLRQKAGDDNALGYIKFQMANAQNIYLHDTPSRAAFKKSERHLSHGCVRVDQPASLAEHVLLETPGGWDQDAISAAIHTGVTRTVGLKTSLPVYVFYWTAFVEDGAVQFRNDIYERDAPIAEALGLSPDTIKNSNPQTVASN